MFLRWKYVKIAVIYLIAISNCSGVEYDFKGGNNQLIFKNSERNGSIAPKDAGQIRFEDDTPSQSQNYNDLNDNNIREPGQPFKFQENDLVNDNSVNFQGGNGVTIQENGGVNYQEDDGVSDHRVKKKKRRKRKPRLMNSQAFQQFYPGVHAPGIGPINSYQGYGLLGRPTGPYQRPGRRPQPSFAADALAAVTGALSSIALHDDYQCVPRLLCEVAGGGSVGPSAVLQSIAGIQPLLSLLSAYSGVNSSPLFVFGRAVFLGMTSKGNTASCRYAYPQCPTDPEQLVHYLNNYNGGFFRYFNNPPSQSPQNVQQFYNQLSISNQNGPQSTYLQQQNQYQNHQLDPGLQNNLQALGFYQNLRPNDQGSYGFYNNPELSQLSQTNQYYGLYNQHANYESQNFKFGFDKNNHSKYSHQVKYRSNGNSTKDTINIQRRIQNRPYNYNDEHTEDNYNYNDERTEDNFNVHRLIFSHTTRDGGEIKNTRASKSLKFPDHNINDNYQIKYPGREVKEENNLIFPDSTNKENRDLNEYYGYLQNEKLALFYQRLGNVYSKLKDYNYDNYGNTASNNKYVSDDDGSNDDDGLQTVYIVRGNGDPNTPEIVKIKLGDKIN